MSAPDGMFQKYTFCSQIGQNKEYLSGIYYATYALCEVQTSSPYKAMVSIVSVVSAWLSVSLVWLALCFYVR